MENTDMGTRMITSAQHLEENNRADIDRRKQTLRLLQLVSPSLPTGGFSYSQGLEYAVEAQWIKDSDDVYDWFLGQIEDVIAYQEIPLLVRLYRTYREDHLDSFVDWCHVSKAMRETRELRDEEQQRAIALIRLIENLGLIRKSVDRNALRCCQVAPFAIACVESGIELRDATIGFAWAWLENGMAAAIKLVPLGQTQGQQILMALTDSIAAALAIGLSVSDEDIGASSPALAIASSLHETQYTRLFRS